MKERKEGRKKEKKRITGKMRKNGEEDKERRHERKKKDR